MIQTKPQCWGLAPSYQNLNTYWLFQSHNFNTTDSSNIWQRCPYRRSRHPKHSYISSYCTNIYIQYTPQVHGKAHCAIYLRIFYMQLWNNYFVSTKALQCPAKCTIFHLLLIKLILPYFSTHSQMIVLIYDCEAFARVCINRTLTVSPSANPIGDYWSHISRSMSMIVIGHSLLY